MTETNEKKTSPVRADGRLANEIRPVTFQKNIAPATDGSVLISVGNTQVICSVGIEENIPRWMRAQNMTSGWLTAEYRMMPCSTNPRSQRESPGGKLGGRTQEIQRLIGRSLRAVVDMEKLGKRTIWIDCDVLQADGGTRTASITGGFVALRLAIDKLLQAGTLESDPIIESLAAVSVGVVDGAPVLDLDYPEDYRAEVDMNVVMTESGRFVELQGSAEGEPFSSTCLQEMITLAQKGIDDLLNAQRAV